MGTFAGHALPGFLFYAFGIRWTYVTLNMYLSSRTPDYTQVNRREAWVKLLCCMIGIMGEFTQKYVGDNNIHHILMYAAFALNAVVELMVVKQEESVPLTIPSSAGRRSQAIPGEAVPASLLFALFVEAFTLKTHTHGRDQVDTTVHSMHTLLIVVNMTAVVVQMFRPHHVMSHMFRSFCFLAQGSWLMNNAFILYNPFPGSQTWDGEDHVQLMNISSLFVCHLFFNVAILFCITLCVSNRSGQSG